MSRKTRILVGAVLTVVGLTGVLAVAPSLQVTAQAGDGTSEIHERMDSLMDAVHGPGTAERIHQVPGGEEMLERCASMMAAMGDGMMGDGMMGDGMMGDGMMDDGMMDDGMMGDGIMDG